MNLNKGKSKGGAMDTRLLGQVPVTANQIHFDGTQGLRHKPGLCISPIAAQQERRGYFIAIPGEEVASEFRDTLTAALAAAKTRVVEGKPVVSLHDSCGNQLAVISQANGADPAVQALCHCVEHAAGPIPR